MTAHVLPHLVLTKELPCKNMIERQRALKWYMGNGKTWILALTLVILPTPNPFAFAIVV